ncbi:MAG: holo-ACP synthase [Acidimicrobiales bacterium]
MIGVGIDTVEVERFRGMLGRREHMVERLFHPDEVADMAGRSDPVPGFAARFAAKEATMKALGVGLGAFGFHEAYVRREESGRPVLVVVGAAARLGEEAGVTKWHITLTHTAVSASAVVIAE